jgi:hypothetical protein
LRIDPDNFYHKRGLADARRKLADLIQAQLSQARSTLPNDSPQMADALAPIGLSLLQQKKWSEAEPLLRECLGIREKTQPDLWSTFSTQSLLGGTLLGQKKYAAAEHLLLAGYEGMKQREATIPEPDKVRPPEALDLLIELYAATNKPDELKKWQAERAKYPAAKSTSAKPKWSISSGWEPMEIDALVPGSPSTAMSEVRASTFWRFRSLLRRRGSHDSSRARGIHQRRTSGGVRTRSGRHARSRACEAGRRGGHEAQGDRQGGSPRILHVP